MNNKIEKYKRQFPQVWQVNWVGIQEIMSLGRDATFVCSVGVIIKLGTFCMLGDREKTVYMQKKRVS